MSRYYKESPDGAYKPGDIVKVAETARFRTRRGAIGRIARIFSIGTRYYCVVIFEKGHPITGSKNASLLLEEVAPIQPEPVPGASASG